MKFKLEGNGVKPIRSKLKRVMLRLTKVLILSLAGSVVLTTSSFAQEAPAQANTLTLEDVIKLSLKQNPELRPYVYKRERSEGLIIQANTGSAKTINVKVEDVLGSGDLSGLSAMQTSVSISWLLEQDVIDAKVNVAETESLLNQFELETQVLDIAADTAKIFVTLLAQQERLKLAELAKYQAQRVLDKSIKRVEAGQLSIIDQLRAKAYLAKQSLEVEDYLHEIEATKAQLSAQWQGDSNFDVVGSLLNIPSIQQLDTVLEDLKSHPRLKWFATQQRISQSKQRLAQVSAEPSWSINAGIKHNESLGDMSFTAGISVPFGAADRNRGKIAALEAEQAVQQAQADVWYQQVSTQLLLLTHQLKHNRHVVEGLTNEVVPALEQASSEAQGVYLKGRYKFGDWYEVEQELIQSKVELIEAYSNIQLFKIELERLTGASLPK